MGENLIINLKYGTSKAPGNKNSVFVFQMNKQHYPMANSGYYNDKNKKQKKQQQEKTKTKKTPNNQDAFIHDRKTNYFYAIKIYCMLRKVTKWK